MHPPSTSIGRARQTRLLTYARSQDAQLFALRIDLIATEVECLRAILDRLVEMGSLALYCLDTSLSELRDWDAVVADLHGHLGGICADAAIGAAGHPATPTPKPQTLVPVWPFERLSDDSEVLTAFGVFMGMPIAFEALPACDDELVRPSPDIARRLSAWRAMLGRDAILGTVAIPGCDPAHAIVASVRAG